MGTRADFYIGRGEKAESIGSIAWDGYPDGIEKSLFKAKTEEQFRKEVASLFADRDDVTLPSDGWPWPWDTSSTTDYAYAFDDGKVHASCFGHEWFNPLKRQPDNSGAKTAVFPDMKDRKNVVMGKRSGTIHVISGDNGIEVI